MYTQSITRNHRTAFILAIDGSGSMAESILFRGRCMTKAEAVATITNDLLFELVERARRSDGVRDYYDIAVVGYSGDDEVRSLLAMGLPRNATAMQAIGYKEFLGVLDGTLTKPEALELVKLRSRQYAKRQLTWLRRKEDIHWILWEKTPDFPAGLQNATEYLLAQGLG